MGNKRTEYGAFLRELRVKNQATLVETAKAAGFTINYMSMVERGKKSPLSAKQARAVLEFLGEGDSYDELMRLASLNRKAVEFDLTKQGAAATDMFLALARASEDGGIDEAMASKIMKTINRSKE